MPGTTLYDPTDPLNVVSLRDHAHVSLVPNGTVIITRPARKRQTTVSAWARVQLAALVNGRYWPTRLIDGWGTISVDSTDADSEQHA